MLQTDQKFPQTRGMNQHDRDNHEAPLIINLAEYRISRGLEAPSREKDALENTGAVQVASAKTWQDTLNDTAVVGTGLSAAAAFTYWGLTPGGAPTNLLIGAVFFGLTIAPSVGKFLESRQSPITKSEKE